MDATSPDPRRDERAREDAHPTTTPPTTPATPSRSVTTAYTTPGCTTRSGPRQFGGANLGAAFFGWLVAVGMTALLTGILAVVATALGYNRGITQSDARARGGVGHPGHRDRAAGRPADRLLLRRVRRRPDVPLRRRPSGSDGLGHRSARHAVAAAWAGSPATSTTCSTASTCPASRSPPTTITLGGIITAVAVLVGTLLAAMFGGTVGRRYHARVDRAALSPSSESSGRA